jgi:tRNA nucleotidyltransferase (CCA-adding enzyme)
MLDPQQMQALADAVPSSVREVCSVLNAAGHAAVTVGGAVRDVLLGRKPGDWDVATSALPDQVVALFRRTIPTGIEHGTVTVLLGRGAENSIEVTTFRGEGSYTDARRPDAVTFGVPLQQDLARRDLVVNAIAYDPIAGAVFDPFDGIGDIARRQIRAVGDPLARFTEDGLRIVRAVRFAATLEFSLTEETVQALSHALPSLTKIARERVCVELSKLLAAAKPSLGLAPAFAVGIVQSIAPELHQAIADRVEVWLAHIDACGFDARLAAWGWPLLDMRGPAAFDDLLRGLTFRNHDRQRAVSLAASLSTVLGSDPALPTVRKLAGELGPESVRIAIGLWRATAIHRAREWATSCDGVLAAGDPLTTHDLAVSGRDLIVAFNDKPGPWVGRVLNGLLHAVHEDPRKNNPGVLLELARVFRG